MLLISLLATILEIGGSVLHVEIADTPSQREKGLGGRVALTEREGMLFVFQEPAIRSFWMKDTLIPLSIGFFDANQQLLHVVEMPLPPPNSPLLPSYSSLFPIQYALEVPSQWFQRHEIVPGIKFALRGSSKIDKIDRL